MPPTPPFGRLVTAMVTPFTADGALDLPAAKWVLIGNPSGALTLPVLGADAVFTFDPLLGYRYTGQLLPGQGGWAISLAGGAISIGV